MIAVAYFIAILVLQLPPMAMKRAYYGIPLVTLLAAIACSGLLASGGSFLSRFSWVSMPLFYCAAAALTIMYVHVPILMVLMSVGLDNNWLQFGIIVMLSLGLHLLFYTHPLSRKLLLGQFSHHGAKPRLG